MALTSYKEVRPWAAAIREAVLAARMPVWLADPAHGDFRNDRRLTEGEKETIADWVKAGAPEGDPSQLPPKPDFVPGWTIGKPDAVFDLGTDYEVPANGVVAYQYFEVPSKFTEDTWVEAAEIRPDQRSVVHHVIVFMIGPDHKPVAGDGGDLLIGWAPGDPATVLPQGVARRVKAGTVFRIQMHYTPNGKQVVKDRSYFGLRFAKRPPERESITGRAIQTRFRIPAGAANHEVRSSFTLRRDVDLESFMPHMHVRGKAFQYSVVYPDGRSEVLLNVPKYDFNWQLNYELRKPLALPKGARIECVAHYDNSANNKFNPDPAKDVGWGDQTWEEMMIGWFNYTIPLDRKMAAAQP
ncbi:MAG: thiol-disulfide isomerase [Bryobacteraceae bacterium]